MSEITKLYENAGVKFVCDGLDCFTCTAKCNNGKYPEFTAEKQLLLLGLLARKYGEVHIINNTPRGISIGIEGISFNLKDFGETIAMVLNTLWQDLTESEQEQIRSILK